MRGGNIVSCGCYRNDIQAILGPRHALPKDRAGLNAVLNRYKQGARARGYEFLLTDDEFDKLTQMSCYYCGTPPSQIFFRKGSLEKYTYSGVDRVDNTKGYTHDNCVSCCDECNYAKKGVTPRIIRAAYGFLNAE